ncbi:fungal-specific transcription factor domain-containing protein [Xylariaceae sp. FL0594]|nr:fungal-specific transcription factor domain-containing protein [Xylariaceae sp. FL0594]
MDISPMSALQSHHATRLKHEPVTTALPPSKKKSRRGGDPSLQKRRCVSTACIACRRRKSKCDAALPSCAACASVYGTECVYDPNSDHRRKGVYREKIDSMKASNSTLQILIEAILIAEEEDVYDIVQRIRTCDNLDAVAESLVSQDIAAAGAEDDTQLQEDTDAATDMALEGERDLARKMGELRVENGTTRFIGGTSHLIHWEVLGSPSIERHLADEDDADEDPITSWSSVTKDPQVVTHLLNLYFNWHYPYFTTLSRSLFYRDFHRGRRHVTSQNTAYCSPLLVNAMLALGCHFTSVSSAYAVAGDSWSKGDHFFSEAKRLIVDNDEYEKPRLTTVQALALMSVREAGCGREAKGWVYSGMSFRMAQDLGLNMNMGTIQLENLDEKQIDARRVTFWGCFLFDKCWSNYLGRLPQLPKNSYNVPKYDVFPDEDAEDWCPYTDSGFNESCKQPARTRTIGLQLSTLCEISSDLLLFFYHPSHIGRSSGKSVELKKLSELHRRLEEWRRQLPAEFEPKDGQLPNVILMHMFFHLQYIHLFRPFLRYVPKTSPLPPHVSPRRICTVNAGAISKLMRLYKKSYNLRQICNIAVYMLHVACTIHLLNLPEKTARRDMIHGVKHLEEIAEDWICGRRTLSIISVLSRKWKVDLPAEAAQVLQRTDDRWGTFNTSDVPSPRSNVVTTTPSSVKNTPSPRRRHDSQSPTRHTASSPGASSPAFPYNSSRTPDTANDTAKNTANNTAATAPSRPDFRPQSQPQRMGKANTIENASTDTASTPDPIPNDFSGLGPTDWASASASLGHSMSIFTQPYGIFADGRVGKRSEVMLPGQAATPATIANSMFPVDGHDWYLKDGVNWQAGFNAWNLGSSHAPQQPSVSTAMPEQQPVFMYGTGAPQMQTQQQHGPIYSTGSDAGQMSAAVDLDFDTLPDLSSLEGWDLSNLE